MSKNKKKNQKRMSPETAGKIKSGFATIISNDAVIRSARGLTGALSIIPIVIALLSVCLAVLPILVSNLNVQGSQAIFASSSANYEEGVAEFVNTLIYDGVNKRDQALELKIENGRFVLSAQDRLAITGGEDRWYTVDRVTNTNGDRSPVFEVFFNSDAVLSDGVFYERVDAGKNPFTNEAREINGANATTYVASYLIFGKESIRFRKRNSIQVATGLTGSYDRLNGVSFTGLGQELLGKSIPLTSPDYVIRVSEFMKDVINRSYETEKISRSWTQTGIFFGVDAGLIILFGLVLFLMTRGKKNPFRIYTFWETQKMAYWASFTPAILSLILGFIFSQYAFIIFMFTYGMRMMWMSMRSLRPTA